MTVKVQKAVVYEKSLSEQDIMLKIAQLFLVISCLLVFRAAGFSESSAFSLLPDYNLQPASLVDVAQLYRYAMISELTTGTLYVYERRNNGRFLLVDTMALSIGKEGYGKSVEGDNKTPVGVYRITSHLTPDQLDDFYGYAAYPVNYPNAWDRLNGRTGYGIWLHAEPMGLKEKNRPLLDSNGCIILSNNDIDKVKQYIDVGYTYIIMTPKVKMVPVSQIKKLRETIYKKLDEWQVAWETLQPQPYLSFYSKDFFNLEKNWSQWVSYKTRIHKLKKFIDISVSEVGIYAYSGERDIMWVEFYQSYRSSNFQSQGWKRQLWKLEQDDEWRIIYEGGG
ncbi:hypothetical protein AB835_13280 [Candidatus Endobugula sertula]|uniref:L,D-TPase catalytic domain-containing protein n=1 Tax=Candidatus Endobugula sertula TaxID=62101 RepID=A0A1D2QM17_9GAMM|nr:hypothetical protein AB835_13280 [Candidatus Endobugula sertula]